MMAGVLKQFVPRGEVNKLKPSGYFTELVMGRTLDVTDDDTAEVVGDSVFPSLCSEVYIHGINETKVISHNYIIITRLLINTDGKMIEIKNNMEKKN